MIALGEILLVFAEPRIAFSRHDQLDWYEHEYTREQVRHFKEHRAKLNLLSMLRRLAPVISSGRLTYSHQRYQLDAYAPRLQMPFRQ